LDLVKALFQQVDPKLTERAKTEIRTGAALGQLMDDNARPLYDRRLLITEEEGGDMLNNLYMKDNNLAGALLVMKDKGTTEKHVQGEDKFKVTGAHPTVVWNITKDTLLSNRSGFNRLLGKGFFNRFLHVRTWLRTASSDIPPLDWNSTSWKELIGRLQRAIEKAKDIERITLHPDANLLQQRWNNRETLTILNSVESGTNSTVQMLTARTAYLATQLQVLLAVIDGRDEITMVDVKASQMLMDYHTKSIRDIYLPSGSSPISSLSPIAQRMLKHFKSSSGARLTKSQIHRKLNDLKADQINIAIEELYDNNEITYDHDTWERNKQISGKKTEAFRVMGEQEKLGINRKKHG